MTNPNYKRLLITVFMLFIQLKVAVSQVELNIVEVKPENLSSVEIADNISIILDQEVNLTDIFKNSIVLKDFDGNIISYEITTDNGGVLGAPRMIINPSELENGTIYQIQIEKENFSSSATINSMTEIAEDDGEKITINFLTIQNINQEDEIKESIVSVTNQLINDVLIGNNPEDKISNFGNIAQEIEDISSYWYERIGNEVSSVIEETICNECNDGLYVNEKLYYLKRFTWKNVGGNNDSEYVVVDQNNNIVTDPIVIYKVLSAENSLLRENFFNDVDDIIQGLGRLQTILKASTIITVIRDAAFTSLIQIGETPKQAFIGELVDASLSNLPLAVENRFLEFEAERLQLKFASIKSQIENTTNNSYEKASLIYYVDQILYKELLSYTNLLDEVLSDRGNIVNQLESLAVIGANDIRQQVYEKTVGESAKYNSIIKHSYLSVIGIEDVLSQQVFYDNFFSDREDRFSKLKNNLLDSSLLSGSFGESARVYGVARALKAQEKLTANFSSVPETGTGVAPLTVSFEDLSEPSDKITSWKWDLTGNGVIDRDLENPTFTYENTGTYTVSLTVSDGQKEVTEIKDNFITVSDPNSGNDVAINSILIEGNKSQFEKNESFKVYGTVKNVGENAATNFNVWFGLKNSDGQVVDESEATLTLQPTEDDIIDLTLQVPSSAPDGNYSVEVRTYWDGDGNPSNNFKTKSVYVGQVPTFTQYKLGDFGRYLGIGESEIAGDYRIEVLNASASAVKVKIVTTSGSTITDDTNISNGEEEFFDGNKLILKNLSSGYYNGGYSAWIEYYIPSNDISIIPNKLQVDAGSMGYYSVISNSSSTRLQSGFGDDMDLVYGWDMKKVNSSGNNFDIQVDVPLNAERKTHEFWPKINNDYVQVLQLEVKEPRNIRGISIDAGENQDYIIGSLVTFSASFVNEGGYALSNIPIKFKITGPNSYEYTDFDEGTFALNAEKEFTFDWNTAEIQTGEYMIIAEAVVPDDPYSNNSVSTTINIKSPPVPEPPVLISPEKGANTISLNPTFEWETITGATTYNLQLSLSENFSDTLKNVFEKASSYQDISLNELATYFWRVRTSNNAGYGDWSEIWSFTTTEAPIEPSIMVPSGPISFGNVEVGQTSTENYTFSASGLTGDVTVSTNGAFEVSLESGSGFGESVTVPEVDGGVVDETIYVRFSPSEEQSYEGQITHSSEGATKQSIDVSGTGINAETDQADKDLHYAGGDWSYNSADTIYADDIDMYNFKIINKGQDDVEPGWFAGVILKNLDTEVEYVVAQEEITSSLATNDTAFVNFDIGYDARGNEMPEGTYAAGFHIDINSQIEETKEDFYNKYVFEDEEFEYIAEKLDEYEPDNNMVSADDAPLISVPFSYQGWINYGWDVDTYSFSVEENHLIEANLTCPDNECNLILYSQNEEEVERGTSFEYLSEDSESYIILVQGVIDSTDYERQSNYNLNITTAENEPTILLGDVTGNGGVSALDGTYILKHTVQISPYPLTGRDSTAADVTCNGSISAFDATYIWKYTVGLINKFSCGNENMAKTNSLADVNWELIFTDPAQNLVEVPVSISGNDVYAFSATINLPEGVRVESISGIPENWISNQNIIKEKFMVSATGTIPLNEVGGNEIIFRLNYSDIKESANINGQIIINEQPVQRLESLEIIDLPTEVTLNQNYPNPFNPTTNISFSLPEQMEVRLEVFNMLGKKVATLAEGNKKAGTYMVSWNASSVSSGIYVYRLITDSKVLINKMMLIK